MRVLALAQGREAIRKVVVPEIVLLAEAQETQVQVAESKD